MADVIRLSLNSLRFSSSSVLTCLNSLHLGPSPNYRLYRKIVSAAVNSSIFTRGGLELLCNSVKIHSVDVDQKVGEEKLTMKDLLGWVRTNLIKERPEMFMKGESVRPGVLVLVNDCDWELSGQLDTTLEEKDVVVFISTLHGG